MAHEKAAPVVFYPVDFLGTSVPALKSTAPAMTPGADPEQGILWLDPEVWPVSLAVSAVIRNKAYNWSLNSGWSGYPSVNYAISAAARSRSMTYDIKTAILSGTNYSLPLCNALYGILPDGTTMSGGVRSSGAEDPAAGYAVNYYTFPSNNPTSEQLASGWSNTVTSGNLRTVWSDVALTMFYGPVQGDVASNYDRTLATHAYFKRVGATYDTLTSVQRYWKSWLWVRFVITGHWVNWEYFANPGAWSVQGSGDYSGGMSYCAGYQRLLSWSDVSKLDPTGAYDYYRTTTTPATSVLFDLQRNDIVSVTGRTF
jgi:hypothetical protein